MRALWAPLALCSLLIAGVAGVAAQDTQDERTYLLHESDDFVAQLYEAAGAINGQEIYDCVEEITTDGVYTYRLMNSPTQDLFVEKHSNEFTEVSPRIKTHVMHFESGGVGVGGGAAQNIPGQPLSGGDNIIGVLPGRDLTKWVVFGGHYDNQAGTVGAIDNASGICTVKELARAFTSLEIEFEATIVFAWWDGEEWGLYGSRAFVADHNSTKKELGLSPDTKIDFILAQSYDIVGINYPALNTWVRYGDGDPTTMDEVAVLNLRVAPAHEENMTLCPSYACYRRLIERDDFETVLQRFQNHSALVQEINYGLFALPPEYVQARDDQYGRSDQMPFIAAGFPAMRIQGSHDEDFAGYHYPWDTLAAAELQAGGFENLLAGFEQAAESGGTVGFYAAMKGDIGDYWNNTGRLADGTVAGRGSVGAASGNGKTNNGVPGFEIALVAIAAIGAIVITSRRRM